MRNSFFVLWIIFICFCSVVFAQRQEIDSLKKVLPKYAESDTNYINILNELAFTYYRINLDTTLILVEKSIFLANKSRFIKGRVNALINKGLVYYVKGDYTQALHMYYEALSLAEEIGYKKGIGNLYNNMANIYSDQGKYLEALENYFKSLQIREEIGNKSRSDASRTDKERHRARETTPTTLLAYLFCSCEFGFSKYYLLGLRSAKIWKNDI